MRTPVAVAVAVAALALACARGSHRGNPAGGEAIAPIPDHTLGLSKTSVFDVPAPPVVKENDSAPGDRPLRPRAFPGAAPVIPHAIADFLPIRKDQNACADCHAIAGPKKPGEPTPIPASHYTDLRRAPGQRGKEVVGARWICTSCHVPQQDVAPLVGNGFSEGR